MALASALAKIAGPAASSPTRAERTNPAVAQLYIVPTGVSELFSTHPATENRIAALQELAAEMGALEHSARSAERPASALNPWRRD